MLYLFIEPDLHPLTTVFSPEYHPSKGSVVKQTLIRGHGVQFVKVHVPYTDMRSNISFVSDYNIYNLTLV